MKNLSLKKSLLTLIILPLLIQVILVAGIFALERDTGRQLQQVSRSRSIMDVLDRLQISFYSVLGTYQTIKMDEQHFLLIFKDIATYTRRMEAQINELKALAPDDPEIAAIAADTAALRKSGLNLAASYGSFLGGGEELAGRRKALESNLHDALAGGINVLLPKIYAKLKNLLDKNDKIQADLRARQTHFLLIGLGIDLFLSIGLAVFVLRTVDRRIHKLSDNAMRLASGASLIPPEAGNDDLAVLDQLFHQMFHELRESARKELLLVDNARDLILSLNERMQVVRSNKACEAFLGVSGTDFLGMYFLDFVASSDRGKLQEFFEKAQLESSADTVQISLKSSSKNIAMQTIWSVEWSDEEKAFFCVVHDMTERLSAEQLREEIFTMVSHDLKAPLTAITNSLVALSESPGSEHTSSLLTIAQRNSERMTTLITDFLDRAKSDSGTLEMELVPLSLKQLFAECAALVSPIVSDLKVGLEVRDTSLIVDADHEGIMRVLVNLITNAAKFSPEKSVIELAAERRDRDALVRVSDSGAGMSQKELERIFERFQQGARRSRSDTGSGLGLAIAKNIVELHGGKIWVESLEGRGTIFYFTLPLHLD